MGVANSVSPKPPQYAQKEVHSRVTGYIVSHARPQPTRSHVDARPLHVLAKTNQPCPTVLFDHIAVLTPRHFRCWAACDLASKTYRVRHLHAAVTRTHSELWRHVGAWLLVILDAPATSRVLHVLALALPENILFKQQKPTRD